MIRVCGINFDHMHMGDNLRMAHDHPDVEIVGVCDEDTSRVRSAVSKFGLSEDAVYTDWRRCIEESRPDLVILCPATGRHREYVEGVAALGVHVLLEKPFASNVAEADAMTQAMRDAGRLLAINWPLAWVPSHRTAKRLIDAGAIGEVREVRFYDGNRGPLWHLADKVETSPEFVAEEKGRSWWYQRASGGGSLLDYLGYGTTLGTWFLGGATPVEVTCVTDEPTGLEVDEHAIVVARYASGLCKFETRWGTFTDPWTHQPQPKCGFVIVGSGGTISSYDYEEIVMLQTRGRPDAHPVPVDPVEPPFQDPVQYMVACITSGGDVEGPLSPEVSRAGQQIVDSAVLSAREKRTVSLLP
ncbi:MAG: glucose-fructose oxidoreductase [Planctomycetes bacterium]|nr:glucose-fructose oxidoreductase [Planctomycetota bacterium]